MTFATRNVGAARAGVAILILFLVGIALASMFMVVVPKDNKDAVLMLIGGLNTALGMVTYRSATSFCPRAISC